MNCYYPFTVTGFTPHTSSSPLPIVYPPMPSTYSIYAPSSPPNTSSHIPQEASPRTFATPYTIYANLPAPTFITEKTSRKGKKRSSKRSSECQNHGDSYRRHHHHEEDTSCHVIHETATLGSRRYVSETLLYNDAVSGGQSSSAKSTPQNSPKSSCTDISSHFTPSRIKETIAFLDGSVQALLPKRFTSPPCYQPNLLRLSLTSGKGTGVFASQTIPTGTRIVVERPIVVTPLKLSSCSSMTELYKAWWEMNLVGESARRKLKRMDEDANVLRQEALADTFDVGLIPRVMSSNGIVFPMTGAPQDASSEEFCMHKAVFEVISRCNHSCSPNASIHWDQDSFSLTLKAVRHINMGEEITIAYHGISLLQSREARRAQVKALYGFTCRCPSCSRTIRDYGSTLHAESGTEQDWFHSDKNREYLANFESSLPTFDDWARAKGADGKPLYPEDWLISEHKQALETIEEEGLAVLGTMTHIDAIAMCYGALGDVAKFRKWMRRGIQCRSDLVEKGCSGGVGVGAGQGRRHSESSVGDASLGYPIHPSTGYIGGAGYADFVAVGSPSPSIAGSYLSDGSSDSGDGASVDDEIGEEDAGLLQGANLMQKWLDNPTSFPTWLWRYKHHHGHGRSLSDGAGIYSAL